MGRNKELWRIDDKEECIELITHNKNGWLLQSLKPELQNDPDVILAALKASSMVIASSVVGKNFRNDRYIMDMVVQSEPYTLKYASKKLKNDKSLVLSAVRNNGICLQFASENLRNCSEVVLEAIQNNPSAYLYVGENLKMDREFTLEICEKSPLTYDFFYWIWQTDYDVIYVLLTQEAKYWKVVVPLEVRRLFNDNDQEFLDSMNARYIKGH